MAFGPDVDAAGLVEELGKRFEVSRRILRSGRSAPRSRRHWNALQSILQKHPFHLDQLEKVVVRIATSEAKTVNDRSMQDISLQQMMAVMLVDKTVSFRAAHDRVRVEDAAITRERAMVELIPDAQLELLYPQLVAIVEVKLKTGETYMQRVDAVRSLIL
jgi:MmgE/PrpD C-terminal domain